MMQPRQPRGQQQTMGLMALGLRPNVQRTIFDAHNTQNLPGDIVRSEGSPATGDPAVDEAYEGLGATFDFYLDVFERNSIDDMGMPLNASVTSTGSWTTPFLTGRECSLVMAPSLTASPFPLT
jgi:Zn-dependent metalloprotease